ncbi:hypothetical protein BGZ67_003664 [Mortierella alpina]|nr:hypothetical protein BGZ67_003664 [Mortierella alpina]
MGTFDEEDEDDDFAPSTPHTIRTRNALPSKSPAIKRLAPRSSSLPQSSHRKEQSKQLSLPSQAAVDQEQTRQETHSQNGMSSTAGSTPSRPRSGVPLSLRKPAAVKIASRAESASNSAPRTRSPPAHTEEPGASAGVIVLDSESESHSDAEDLIRRPSRPSPSAPLDLAATQVGGVSSSPRKRAISILSSDEIPSLAGPQNANNILTQDSVSSSQGSVDLMNEDKRNRVMDDSVFYSQEDAYAHTYGTQWSLSPDIANPFLTDLVATPTPTAETEPMLSPGIDVSQEVESVSRVESTMSSTMCPVETSAKATETDFSLSGYDLEQDRDGSLECFMCGKFLAHLDEARVAYHINNCIDEQQVVQQTAESLDLDSRIPQASLSQGEFAGAQVDYLTRVKRCPICKLDWPLKTRQTKSGSTAPKKARQKVEHMKKCAKAHNRTVQSLLYQIRLLKEKYERSLMLGISMDSSDPIGPSQEMYQDEDVERNSSSDQDDNNDNSGSARKTTSGDTQEEEGGADSNSGVAARKSKSSSTVMKQVVSMADTADGDFASDAVITTVHAPAPSSSKSKLSRLQRMHEDQNDDHLQLALAISMSVSSAQDSESPFMSRPDSSSESATRATTWSMVPMEKTASKRGGKRRKTERERNETTVLPFAEVQQLIQANATALLFPETEDFGHVVGDGHDRLMKTPPWKPSRFAGMTKADLEISLSQSSEPDATAAESLWNLSHLKDTREIDAFYLHAEAEQTAVDSDGDQMHDHILLKTQHPEGADLSTATDSEKLPPTFSREQYVSRFMKRFLKQDQERASHSAGAGSPIEPSPSTPGSEDISYDAHGAVSRQSDNKFSSPLWSVARTRRISFKDQRQNNEELFSNVLKSEISGHLEALEQQIQQAKLTAYRKIIESIKRHPIAAGLSASADPDIIEQGSDCEPVEENTQDLDASQQPTSPLLRFSKAADPERSVSPATLGVYSSQPLREISPAQDDCVLHDNPLDHGGDPRDYPSMDMYQEDLPFEDYDQTGVMAYSPAGSPVMLATSPCASSPSDLNISSSPVMPTPSGHNGTSAYGLGILTPSGLPPPVDFVKLMQRVSGTTSETAADSEQLICDIGGVGPKQTIPPPVRSVMTAADDNGDPGILDDMQYPASQRATFPTSRLANRNEEILDSVMPAPSAPSTPSRTKRGQLQDTETGSAPPSQVGTPSGGPSKTPSKRRRLAVVRAEAMAAESAKAVANIKAQSRMPMYHLMSIARLRLAATTFGLKPASKSQLVQQLTALWKTLNPTPPQGEEAAGGGNGSRGIGLSPSGIAAGGDDGLFDEDEDMNEFGISHSQRLRRAIGDRSDDNDAGLADGGIGSSGTQVLELDSDCSPIVSEAEDMAAGEVEEGDDDDEGEDEEEDDAMAASCTGLGIDFAPSQVEGSGMTTPTLERQLYEFLNTTTHLRKQILTYKPLDLEQVWEECREADIDCTRQQLRQFLDQQGIICFVPAHSSLSSWRKTRAKKRKRVGK